MSKHTSVLLEEAIEQLAIQPDGRYLDCTFGRGGHSRAILAHLNEQGKLFAFDRDLEAINSAEAQQLTKDSRFELIHSDFSRLEPVIIAKNWQGQLDGILLDLGVSSPQLDNSERGFSFMRDGYLDMRMDSSQGLSASEWLAQVEESDLVHVLFHYGEERFARRIAAAIIKQRQLQPITTTLQLAKLVEQAIPFKEKHKHPATRTFQAIRIEINQELEEIKQVLDQAVNVLKAEGRLVVIAFHSLEDRIVKRYIRDESRGKYQGGRLPPPPDQVIRLKKMGKAYRASAAEIKQNPRSRSAIMRVAKRLSE